MQQKKKDIIGSKIQKRSKAHEIIRRMLSSLGDPYTRFLSPDEVISSYFGSTLRDTVPCIELAQENWLLLIMKVVFVYSRVFIYI